MIDPLQKARDLMNHGQYRAAKKIYAELSMLEPENQRLHFQLGLCHLADRQYADAERQFMSCLNINPHSVEVLVEMGDLQFKLGNDEKAREYLHAACDEDPDNIRARTFLARLYEHSGDFQEAIAQYNIAVERSPASESPRHDLALAYGRNGDHLESYLLLQELLDEADLGFLWSQINATEADLDDVNLEGTKDYIEMLKDEMEQVELQFYQKYSYPIQYTQLILDALECFLNLSEDDIREVRSEISVLQMMGVGFSGSERRFRLNSLNSSFSGLEMGCYLYTAQQLTRSASNMSEDYSSAFIQALNFIQQHQ